MKVFFRIMCITAILIAGIEGHGMMLEPAGRSSRWRFDSSAPVNYNDNSYYCGGFSKQWYQNNGKCGVCGDDYAAKSPRANELGGIYGGKGVIVRIYKNSNTAQVIVRITANHKGFIFFNLCNLDKHKRESEECFLENRLPLADGSDRLYVGTTVGDIKANIVLSKGLVCKHCVLRWTYNAGNNWGICEDGKGALGCGAQETFKSCADISII